jgi:hypothetical protein
MPADFIKLNRHEARAGRFLPAAYLAMTLSSQVSILPSLNPPKS